MASYDNITESDNKSIKSLDDVITRLSKLEVRIGYQQGKDPYPDEKNAPDVMDVAITNELGSEVAADYVSEAMAREFGNSEIPARPFMKQTVDNHVDEIDETCQGFLDELMGVAQSGKNASDADVQKAMNGIGSFMVALMQEEIVNGDFEPNSPVTVERKGSDKPLIDTGHMRQSIHFYIHEKKSGETEEQEVE